MVIRRSSLGNVQQLIADLDGTGDDGQVRRETAIARLRVIGARALRQVAEALLRDTPPPVKIALLRVVEGQSDVTLVEPVLAALSAADADVRAAAASAGRSLLDTPRGAELLDRLTALATSTSEPAVVRLAAIGALSELPESVTAPLFTTLQHDTDPAIRLATTPSAAGHEKGTPDVPGTTVAAGASDTNPQALLEMLARDSADLPLSTLHRLVNVAREHERMESRRERRADWLSVRGSLHQLLARRDSRVALYDLRESFEQAETPLPETYVAAMQVLGDASCLEAVAAAYVRAAGEAMESWRAALSETARAIIARERLTPRHAVVKRLHTKWGAAVTGLC